MAQCTYPAVPKVHCEKDDDNYVLSRGVNSIMGGWRSPGIWWGPGRKTYRKHIVRGDDAAEEVDHDGCYSEGVKEGEGEGVGRLSCNGGSFIEIAFAGWMEDDNDGCVPV